MESVGQFFADAGEWIRSLELNRNTIVEALLVAAILAVVGAAGAGLHSLWRRRIQRRLAESAPKPSIELWGSTFAPETANPKQWILVVPPETDVVFCPMQLTLINPTESPIEQPILVLKGPLGMFISDDSESTQWDVQPGVFRRQLQRVVQSANTLGEMSMELPTITRRSAFVVNEMLALKPTVDMVREIEIDVPNRGLFKANAKVSINLYCWVTLMSASAETVRGEFKLSVVPAPDIESAVKRLLPDPRERRPAGMEPPVKPGFGDEKGRALVLKPSVKKITKVDGKNVVELDQSDAIPKMVSWGGE